MCTSSLRLIFVSCIELVISPSCNIIFDIFCDFIHIVCTPDDVVVETGLPGERDVVLMCVIGDGTFQTTDNR